MNGKKIQKAPNDSESETKRKFKDILVVNYCLFISDVIIHLSLYATDISLGLKKN